MSIFDIFQVIGGIFLAISYVPQIVQNYKSKSVKDLNLSFWSILLVGLVFMLVNAINLMSLGSYTYAITQSFNVILAAIIVVQILYYRKRGE